MSSPSAPAKVNALRTLCFGFAFILGSFLTLLVMYPASFVTSQKFATRYLRSAWLHYTAWLTCRVAGLSYKINDPYNALKTQGIFAFNHQSNWESFHNFSFIDSTVTPIAKSTLTRIPLYARCFLHCSGLLLDRNGSKKNLQDILKQGSAYIHNQHSIYICPEGTRKPYGTPYKSRPGIYLLYKAFNLPVIPVAHNSGLYWHGLAGAKTGCIHVEVAHPIPTGLTKKQFLENLDTSMQEIIRKIDKSSASSDNHRP